MNKNQIIQRMYDQRVLPVFRTDRTDKVLPAAQAFVAGGMSMVEFTMTMPRALELIERGRAELPPHAVLGAGTVLDAPTARAAISAGAQFVVSPGLAPEVIEVAHRYGVPVVPGAATPTEIMEALKYGVDVIKVFPANVNFEWFADLVAPFGQVRFMAAAGGITPPVAGRYFAAGAAVVTIAGQNYDKAAFEAGDFARLEMTARRYLTDLNNLCTQSTEAIA